MGTLELQFSALLIYLCNGIKTQDTTFHNSLCVLCKYILILLSPLSLEFGLQEVNLSRAPPLGAVKLQRRWGVEHLDVLLRDKVNETLNDDDSAQTWEPAEAVTFMSTLEALTEVFFELPLFAQCGVCFDKPV